MQLGLDDDEGFMVLPVLTMTKMTCPLLGNSGLAFKAAGLARALAS